jgi:uncharacterized membrane protein
MERREERSIRNIFDLGLIIKAIESAFEVAGGVAVLFAGRTLVPHIVDLATNGELAHDPDDFVANYLRDAAHAFAVHAHYLLAGYLILRGALKLVLAILILRGVKEAYPFFIIMLGLFASYEAYLATVHGNYWLGGAALFDTALIFLTAYEYRRRYGAHSAQV